ncbi:MAG: anaerobic magnesium-protoporphyrin IX monomethyl ester cyclase [Flavobacteriaceae bacterium]
MATQPAVELWATDLGNAAALLENDGIDVAVIDGVALNLSDADYESRILEFNPDVIVVEPNSAVVDDVLKQITRIRAKTSANVIVIGSHVTEEYKGVFKQYAAVDYAVAGEYEYGLLNLLQHLRSSEPLTELQGTIYGDSQGNITSNGIAPAVDDLDALPLPARHLFPAYFDNNMDAYHHGFNQLSPAIDKHATRGCPYRCNFCVWVQVLYRNGSHRLRTPAKIIDEILCLQDKYNVKEVYFDDDNFTANKKFVTEFCDELIKQNNTIKWSVLADAIALSEPMLVKMASAACIGVKFGLDSADSDVLRKCNKPLKVSRVDGLVKKAKALGIKTHMTVVLGLSGETKATLQKTFDFSCQLDIDSIQYSLATSIPGTALFEGLKKEQKLHFKRWDELDGYSSSVIEYEDFDREYIETFMMDVHTRWLRARLRHPLWIARQIKYLARLTRVQGLSGFTRRLSRGARLLAGDTAHVGTNQGA